jgi:3-phenylpropionate/trans-cinnamate dioxygenase ferredoxin component
MPEDGWLPALPLADLAERKATKVSVDGQDVLLVRDGERLFAIGNRCTHQGAPLHRGPVRFSGSLDTVQCPVHGSMFGLSDGKVLRGPAMQPVSAYDARVNGDTVEIRPRD